MKISLKDKLFEAIKGTFPNTFSIERVEQLAKESGYKISNAERRLRELCDGDDPRIRPVRNEKGYIMGYLYVETPKPFVMPIKPEQGQMFKTTYMN